MLVPESPTVDTPTNGLVFLSPPIDYQMADEWYALATADHFWFQWRFRALLRLIGTRELEGPVLEVGCGHGVVRGQLERAYGCPVDGCDVNLSALSLAPSGRGGLYVYDIHQRRPEWREHFGTIFLLDTLEHIPEPTPFLESLAWHLRQGGMLAINVPALQSLYSRYDEVAGHVKRYNRYRLRSELATAGFTLPRSAYWGGSLLPVAAARKAMLRFISPERVIERGFQPGSAWTDGFLRLLMAIETGLPFSPPLGTSLLGLARKESVS